MRVVLVTAALASPLDERLPQQQSSLRGLKRVPRQVHLDVGDVLADVVEDPRNLDPGRSQYGCADLARP